MSRRESASAGAQGPDSDPSRLGPRPGAKGHPSREPGDKADPGEGDVTVTGPSSGPMSRTQPVARAGWREKGESEGVEVVHGWGYGCQTRLAWQG